MVALKYADADGKRREVEGGERRKKVKKKVIFNPTTHHSQVSQPHLALRHPPPTKLGEAKPARTPVCPSGYDTVLKYCLRRTMNIPDIDECECL